MKSNAKGIIVVLLEIGMARKNKTLFNIRQHFPDRVP